MELRVGQAWRFSDEPELAASRLVIGALVDFDSGVRLVCCSAVPWPSDGAMGIGDIVAFMPFAEDAFRRSVHSLDGIGDPAEDFGPELQAWRDDPRGLRYFTVPFEGSLDRLVALQMAALANPFDADPAD